MTTITLVTPGMLLGRHANDTLTELIIAKSKSSAQTLDDMVFEAFNECLEIEAALMKLVKGYRTIKVEPVVQCKQHGQPDLGRVFIKVTISDSFNGTVLKDKYTSYITKGSTPESVAEMVYDSYMEAVCNLVTKKFKRLVQSIDTKSTKPTLDMYAEDGRILSALDVTDDVVLENEYNITCVDSIAASVIYNLLNHLSSPDHAAVTDVVQPWNITDLRVQRILLKAQNELDKLYPERKVRVVYTLSDEYRVIVNNMGSKSGISTDIASYDVSEHDDIVAIVTERIK